MATTTYVPIETYTVAGTSTNTITFGAGNTLPQTYTDLIMVFQGGVTAGSADFYYQFNNITTGGFYSTVKLRGNGTNTGSTADINQDNIPLEWYGYLEANMNVANISSIMNYSSNATFKTVIARSSSVSSGVNLNYGLWRKTDPITQITVKTTASFFATGSTFTLYGIQAWSPESTPKATGGYVYSDSTYWYHSFPFSGTFTPNQSLSADILVVAGGGGGSNFSGGGGGGAGGLLAFSSQSLSATGYGVVVGAGGSSQSNGGNSQFGGLTTAVGGGASTTRGTAGNSGGSGGGGSANAAGGAGAVSGGAASPSGQGNAGGSGNHISGQYESGGGGGGAVAAGQNGTSNSTGAGGDGSSSYSSWGLVTSTGENVSGTVYYAGGGAGYNSPTGGLGGGGKAFNFRGTSSANGLPTSGGGGASGQTNIYNGGNGGSGIVIVRYSKA